MKRSSKKASRIKKSTSPNPDAPRCGCRWLEKAAKDPNMPVTFDAQINEYQLVLSNGRGRAIFYHCPFCGGQAPDSLRDTLFADVSAEESQRLYLLTENILAEEDMRARFGEPDHILPTAGSSTTPGSDTEAPETTVTGRCLVYKSLSETADVNVIVDRYGKVRFSFSGKYLGRPSSS